MRILRLGRTGLRVSELCLGTMTFGASTDADEAGHVLDRFANSGGNFLDTAVNYAGGASEELLGRLLADRRDRAIASRSKRAFAGYVPTTSTSTGFMSGTAQPRSTNWCSGSTTLWRGWTPAAGRPKAHRAQPCDSARAGGRGGGAGQHPSRRGAGMAALTSPAPDPRAWCTNARATRRAARLPRPLPTARRGRAPRPRQCNCPGLPARASGSSAMTGGSSPCR